MCIYWNCRTKCKKFMKFDLKGLWRPLFIFLKRFCHFSAIFKKSECYYYRDAFFLINDVTHQRSLEFIKGHPFIYRSTFSQVYFFVSNLILPNFGMNANITKMQIFDDMKFDLIITLTYVLMDNFCSCFPYIAPYSGS